MQRAKIHAIADEVLQLSPMYHNCKRSCEQPLVSFLQVSNDVIANQIQANLNKLVAKLQTQSNPASPELCDQEDLEQAEAVVKAKRLSAAASIQPMGSSVWCELMQSLVKLMGELAVPQQLLQQARKAFHQAKQKTLACYEKPIELKAHRNELLRVLSLCISSNNATDRSVQSACACMMQLGTRHAVHQRVCAIVQANHRCNSV